MCLRTSAAFACGTTTTPSISATMMSFGLTVTPAHFSRGISAGKPEVIYRCRGNNSSAENWKLQLGDLRVYVLVTSTYVLPEWRIESDRRANGIPIAEGNWAALQKAAARLNL